LTRVLPLGRQPAREASPTDRGLPEPYGKESMRHRSASGIRLAEKPPEATSLLWHCQFSSLPLDRIRQPNPSDMTVNRRFLATEQL